MDLNYNLHYKLHLMNLVLIESMDKFIHDECKANCEACQVNSDLQFDHCK